MAAGFTRVSTSVGARADYVQGGGGNTSAKLKLDDALGKAVADDDDTLWRIAAIVLKVDGLTLHPLVQTGLPPGGEIGLDHIVHLPGKVILGDPAHAASSFRANRPCHFIPLYQKKPREATKTAQRIDKRVPRHC